MYDFKNILSYLFIFLLTACLFGQTYNTDADIFTKELVVKFKSKAFGNSDFRMEKNQKVADLEQLNIKLSETRKYLSKFDKVNFTKVFKNVEWGDTISVNKKGEKVRIHDLSQFYTIKFSKPVKMWKTIYELRSLPGVEHADPQTQKINDIEPDDLHGQGNQWYLPKINAADAWDITTGNSTIKIAIIDEGVDPNHPDLQNKLTGGENTFSGDHGTMVAGVAGAETDNGTGIASLGWNISLVPFDDQNSGGLVSDINEARTQDTVDIINCSWRTVIEDPNDSTKYINYSYPTVEYAIANCIQVGIVVVASAGNPPGQWNGLNPSEYPPFLQYPAAYTGVIAVSATNSSDNFPSGYNYGSHVDVSAPSISILTTNINNGYTTVNGTSFGSPLTAALAGLCLSINPDLDNSDVETIIEDNSENLGTTGWDDYFGEGRIDAFEALKHTPTWNNVIKNDMYGYNGGSIKYQSTSYTSPYTIPEYLWQQNVTALFDHSYGGIDYIFSHWSDGNTNYTRELTLANNGNYSAVYTGHLYSISNTATSTNGSRKVWSNDAWDPNNSETPNNPGYWVVYEDNGDIYYTEYRVEHVSGQYFYWTNEELISDGSGNSKYPSIAIAGGGYGYSASDREYCIVWQQYIPSTGKYKIVYREFNTSGGDDPHVITDQSTSPNSKPVVGVSSGTFGFSYGYDWHFVWDNGNGLKFAADEYYIVDVPNTNSNSHNPTITNDPHLFYGQIAIAWENSSDIYFQQFDFGYTPLGYPVENITENYSYLFNCQNPSIAMNSGGIMLTWQGRHGNYAEKIENTIIEAAIPPPVSMKYDPIFALRKDVYDPEWDTLKELMYSTYKNITPSVGAVDYYDFSVLWKVYGQNLLAKLDYVDGEGWDLNSEIETISSAGCKDPSISTSSNVISAVWSENSTSPYKIKHDQLTNPTESSESMSIKNRLYRKSLIDLSKINENLEGYFSVTMGEIEDLENQLLVRFKQDSLTSGSFMSSPVFNPVTATPVVKMNIGVFGEGLEIKNLTAAQNTNLFRVVLKSSKNTIIRVLRNFNLQDLEPDSSGTFFEWKELKINLQSLIGKHSRIEVELFPNTYIKYKPSVVEVLHFDPEIGTPKMNNNEMALSKTDNTNILTITDFALHSAYPNPFNPVTNITFEIPSQTEVSLVVYNIQGQVVSELFKGNKETGRYTFKFDGSKLSSGVYFYELIAGGYKEVRKMMLVK